jgi:hypothetical protein
LSDPKYILDANVFIEAHKHYYAFDVAPGFWKHIMQYAEKGNVFSIDRVHDELKLGKDELLDWVGKYFIGAFISTNEVEVIEAYREIMKWVNDQKQFAASAKAEFAGASAADGWLVACAKAKGYVVVTLEKPVVIESSKIKIPNICESFGVPYINTFDMLRRLGVRWE